MLQSFHAFLVAACFTKFQEFRQEVSSIKVSKRSPIQWDEKTKSYRRWIWSVARILPFKNLTQYIASVVKDRRKCESKKSNYLNRNSRHPEKNVARLIFFAPLLGATFFAASSSSWLRSYSSFALHVCFNIYYKYISSSCTHQQVVGIGQDIVERSMSSIGFDWQDIDSRKWDGMVTENTQRKILDFEEDCTESDLRSDWGITRRAKIIDGSNEVEEKYGEREVLPLRLPINKSSN